MERVHRTLEIPKGPRPHASAVEDPRPEREVLNREFALSTVESVARVPVDWSSLRERRVLSPGDTQEPAGHAYRMLRTQVLQRARANGMNAIGVVSAVNGEGKTLTAVNLAVSLAAEPNQTVLLLDLDLRRPALARTLELQVERGLESWLGGDEPTRNVCYGVEGLERLFVLPTLAPVPNSSETLASLSTRRLFNELKDRDTSRLLVVDLPPVLLSDDALMVAPLLDGVVLVVNERRTRREDVVRVVELLANTRIIGSVLNCSSESEQRAY